MARRGQGEGSVFQRKDGRWAAKLTADNKTYTRYARTKRDALAKMKDLQREVTSGVADTGTLTVGQYLADWLRGRKDKIEYSSWRNYEAEVRLRIAPELGDVELRRLTPKLVGRFYASLAERGTGRRAQKYSHQTLSKALNDAVRAGLIALNPCSRVEPPKTQKRTVQAVEPGRVLYLLDSIQDRTLYLAVEVAVFTGLRRGEVSGLRWEDIDLDRGVMHVSQQIALVDAKWAPKRLKTDASRRTVALPAILREDLRPRRKDSGYVISRPDGGFVIPQWLSYAFAREIRAIDGVPDLHFHDLRHINASLLLAAGANPKVLQQHLGHSQISITMDIYSHLLPNLEQEAIQGFDRLLLKSISPATGKEPAESETVADAPGDAPRKQGK
jgi:integrase